ncbi:MAG: DUF642 domain-containing protein [Acidimicrobiales bacterium]
MPTTTTAPPTTIPEISLINGGFEAWSIASGSFQIVGAAEVPGWTSSSGSFEVWHRAKSSVGSADGSHLIELNVHNPTTIHQDFASTPGSTLTWSFSHRGRERNESIELLIGSPSRPTSIQVVSTGTGWKQYSGTYKVPRGQTVTRIAFRSLEPGGSANLLDGVRVRLGS